jgi:Bacterial Ig domain
MFLLLPPSLKAAPTGPNLSGSFTLITAGSVVNLTSEGEIDWVHWGLYTETSLDRKAGVVPQISDFTLLDASNGFAYVYQFADNANGYSWSDGTPTAVVNDTTTGVWAYGTPQIGSGFQITAPADTSTRTCKVYVGAYGARGKFEAYLSDGSARGYTNTALFNQSNGESGVYTITYAAGSAGQQLIVRWTLSMPLKPDGNVTLQAAALTSSSANNPPYIALTSPAENASFAAGSTINVEATANDLDGTINSVDFYADGVKIGTANSSPYGISWNNVAAGQYVLTATAMDSQGAVSTSGSVEILVNGPGGSLAGGLTVPLDLPNSVNLTVQGTADWTHWDLATNSLFNRKADVSAQISNFTKIGSNLVERYADNYTGYSWSDGTPTPTANDTTTGVFTTGLTNGFELTAPADSTPRTLKVYVGLYGAEGNFQAWLSDFSAPAYTDTTLSNYYGNAYAVYTITYTSTTPGQSLIVRYRPLTLFDLDFGNVTLQAATLTVNAGGNLNPTVGITAPADGTILTAPASFTIEAQASDSDGSVSQVEFFNGALSLGVDATDPYSVPVSNLAAGGYTFSAVATDNLGATASDSISLVVNDPPTASIISPTNGQSFIAPANITISALASDTDGAITNVEFFEGANKLGELSAEPYDFDWNNVPAGSYSLTVRATDDRGAMTTSSAIAITLTNSPAAGVILLDPAWVGSDFVFSFASEAGHTYEVQYSDALGTNTWQVLTSLDGNGSTLFVTNRNVGVLQRFYRVETK